MKLLTYKKFLYKPIDFKFNTFTCYINGCLLSYNLKLNPNHFIILTNTKLLIHKNYIRTFFSIFFKIIDGISHGFKAILYLKGKGLRIQLKKINNIMILYLKLGYSHKIFFKLPQNIWIQTLERRRTLILFCLNFYDLRLLLMKIRTYYPVNLYKIRGFYEPTEIIKQKKGNLN